MPNQIENQETKILSDDEKLQNLSKEIDELKPSDDGTIDKSDDEIKEIDGMLTTNFANYLKDPDRSKVLNDMYNVVLDANNRDYGEDRATIDSIKKVKEFLEPMVMKQAVEGGEDIAEVAASFTQESGSESDSLNGNNSVDYKGKGKIDDSEKEEQRGAISKKIEEIKNRLDGNDKLNITLDNIEKVVNGSMGKQSENVGKLQQFIYKNLKGEAQTSFLEKNFRLNDGKRDVNKPDGMFGTGLLEGVNAYLDSLDNYSQQVELARSRSSEIQEADNATENRIRENNNQIAKARKEAEQKEAARKAEQTRVEGLTLGKVVDAESGNEIKWSDDVKKQMNNIIKIEELSSRNNQLLGEINKINEGDGNNKGLKENEAKLKGLKNTYDKLKDSNSRRADLSIVKQNIKDLSDTIKKQRREIADKERQISNIKDELFFLGSKEESITKLDKKIKNEYMDLFIKKQKAEEEYKKSIVNIPDGISSEISSKLAAQNKKAEEDWGKKASDFDNKMNAILKFGSWKIKEDDGTIIDDNDNVSDYRKYVRKEKGEKVITETVTTPTKTDTPADKPETSNPTKTDTPPAKPETSNPTKTDTPPAKPREKVDSDPEKVAQYGLKLDALSKNLNQKISLGIPADKNVYTHPQRQNCYFYKDGGKIYEIQSSFPYRKWEVGDGNPPIEGALSMNVCQSGVGKFKEYLKGLEGVNVAIESSKYYLKGKTVSVELNDKLLYSRTSDNFFGATAVNNRVKALALAIKSKDNRNELDKNKYKELYINTNGDLVCKNPAGRIEHPDERAEKLLAKKDVIKGCGIKKGGGFVRYIRTLS